jgi:hypothetical protein
MHKNVDPASELDGVDLLMKSNKGFSWRPWRLGDLYGERKLTDFFVHNIWIGLRRTGIPLLTTAK